MRNHVIQQDLVKTPDIKGLELLLVIITLITLRASIIARFKHHIWWWNMKILFDLENRISPWNIKVYIYLKWTVIIYSLTGAETWYNT